MHKMQLQLLMPTPFQWSSSLFLNNKHVMLMENDVTIVFSCHVSSQKNVYNRQNIANIWTDFRGQLYIVTSHIILGVMALLFSIALHVDLMYNKLLHTGRLWRLFTLYVLTYDLPTLMTTSRVLHKSTQLLITISNQQLNSNYYRPRPSTSCGFESISKWFRTPPCRRHYRWTFGTSHCCLLHHFAHGRLRQASTTHTWTMGLTIRHWSTDSQITAFPIIDACSIFWYLNSLCRPAIGHRPQAKNTLSINQLQIQGGNRLTQVGLRYKNALKTVRVWLFVSACPWGLRSPSITARARNSSAFFNIKQHRNCGRCS